MLFNSLNFMLFFPLVVLIYCMIPKKIRYIWLLITSYYFYMSWNPLYAILIGISTVITYTSGIVLDYVGKRQLKRAATLKKVTIFASFASNLGILFFYKYFDFTLAGMNQLLSSLKIEMLDIKFDVLLPVGISFYTFQALSYTVDVYRKDIEAEKNPLRYALFVSFFPQLVAGPIERSGNLLKQLRQIHTIKSFDFIRFRDGLILMIWGLFQKMVIADRVAILVNTVFEQYYFYNSFALLVAAVGFAIQIYCDFASYSTIAFGASKVMGIDLMENFNTPYFSTSIREFWKRWHISLSSWFRDYLYIPLGGSRCSKVRTYFNTIITFLVSGLWHGASMNFVVWGLLHGCYQIVEDMMKPMKEKMNIRLKVKTQSFSYRFTQMLVTFILVDFAWIFFRLSKVEDGFKYIKRIFTKFDPWSLFNGELYELGLDRFEFQVLVISLVMLFLVSLIRYVKKQNVAQFLGEQMIWFRWIIVLIWLLALPIYGIYGMKFESSQFIYFQF